MAAPASSVKAVVVALAANSLVTVIKLIAFLASGSGAMLSEAIHSAADTGNQALLYLGLRRGARASDEEFHYGYGGERFVFGLLSASGIFFIGCGVTLYHGVQALLDPRMPNLGALTFVVLAVSLVVEAGALVVAVRSVASQRGSIRFWPYVRQHADPAAVAVLLEDSAAVLGLCLATGGIILAHLTGDPRWDAVGSILVGLVLGVVAVYLVLENRELLLGRAVPDGVEARFVALLRGWPSIRAVHDVKTRQLTPEAFKLKAEVAFDEALVAEGLGRILRVEIAAVPEARRVELSRALARCAIRTMGEEIDAIEDAVRKAIPAAKHIDLEVDRPADPLPQAAAAPKTDLPG